jgi:hypothetical protein
VSTDERYTTWAKGERAGLPNAVAGDLAAAVRRLLPVPQADVLPLPRLLDPAAVPSAAADTVTQLASGAGEQAASIVAQAASILDEEMAKGVLAARRASPKTSGAPDAVQPALQQVHDLVDQLAALWTPAPAVQAPAGEAVAELRPAATVRPGQPATIAMLLCNRERVPVHLTPAVTDLLGSRGGRIPGTAIECSDRECTLAPDAQRELTIRLVVPPETAAGSYTGLLVVAGVDYLRALITIDVA